MLTIVESTRKNDAGTSTRRNASPRFFRARPVTNPRMRLFCFPYAGGSAAVFHRWPELIPANVELVAIQYPGRGARLGDTPCDKLDVLLDDVESAVLPMLDLPFVFFGHSMGAAVAFELTRRLRGINKLPLHLFLSGRGAPHLPSTRPPIHDLPDDRFLDALRDLNGTPHEVLSNKELMQMILPVLRADFRALETWQHTDGPPFDIGLSVFGGILDSEVPRDHLEAWGAYTTERTTVHMFNGDHFFLHEQYPFVLEIVNRVIANAR